MGTIIAIGNYIRNSNSSGSVIHHVLHYVTSDGKHYVTSDGFYYRCKEE